MLGNSNGAIELHSLSKKDLKTSNRSLIRRHLSPEKKIDLFAFLAAFNIVISEKEIEMGNLKKPKL